MRSQTLNPLAFEPQVNFQNLLERGIDSPFPTCHWRWLTMRGRDFEIPFQQPESWDVLRNSNSVLATLYLLRNHWLIKLLGFSTHLQACLARRASLVNERCLKPSPPSVIGEKVFSCQPDASSSHSSCNPRKNQTSLTPSYLSYLSEV